MKQSQRWSRAVLALEPVQLGQEPGWGSVDPL